MAHNVYHITLYVVYFCLPPKSDLAKSLFIITVVKVRFGLKKGSS